MKGLRKTVKFLTSMPFAIALLMLLAAACAVSSLVTQGQSFAWYAEKYGERMAGVILALHMDDAYHSWWFVLLSGFLCLNLLGCSLVRIPALIRRGRRLRDPAQGMKAEAQVTSEGIAEPEKVFSALRMPAPARVSSEEGEKRYSVRNAFGIWGAWICHLGILLLIAGFALGQITRWQGQVYGVPGQTRRLEGTGLEVEIRDFRVETRENDTVEQYTAEITVRDPASGKAESASVSVNEPASLFGMKFYQNSTGYAARVRVLRNEEPLQQEILCAGESLAVADKPELAVLFRAFYPDLVMEGGAPATASSRMDNPGYLYIVTYQGEILGMNVLQSGEKLTIDEYTVLFDEPRSYTLLAVKRDAFTPLAMAGGLLTLLGLYIAFYLRPSAVWAVRREDGSWTVYGRSGKDGVLFREQFAEAAAAAGGQTPDTEKSEGGTD